MRDHETHTSATRATPPQDDPGVPLSTWLISGVALVVALTAGALVLSARPKPSLDPTAAEASPGDKVVVGEPANVAGPKNPLEITASFLDAQQRSRIWAQAAVLSGIELIVEDGKPRGPIVFEFGEVIGPNVPGAALSEKRHTISYEDGKVETATNESTVKRVALPEPNCPLEVAFSTLIRSGAVAHGRVGVLYVQSQKHARPIWLMTNEAGEATSLNAENCALLRR